MTRDEMDALTAGMTAKAEKIRTLDAAGVSCADIARYLDIRYQHAYNVLLRAGRIVKVEPSEPLEVAEPGSFETLELREDGSVVLPESLRATHELTVGDILLARSTPEGILLVPQAMVARQVAELARRHMPGQAALIEALLNPKPGGARSRP